MIILKYGNLKRKQKKTRWKAICDDCGCKVIVEKDDVEKFCQDFDYDGNPYTKFTWICPFCHETQEYDKYDSKIYDVKKTIEDWMETLKDWAGDKITDLVDNPIGIVFIIMALTVTIIAVPVSIYIRYENTHNIYKIKWIDDDGDSRTSWTNEYEIDGNIMTFIDEDEHIRKIQADEANVIVLKEEE